MGQEVSPGRGPNKVQKTNKNSYAVHRISMVFQVPGAYFGLEHGVQNRVPNGISTLKALGSLLEGFSKSFGAILEAIGAILEPSGTVLTPSRSRFGSSWGPDRIPKVALWGCKRVPNGAPEMPCAQHGKTTKVEDSTKDFNAFWVQRPLLGAKNRYKF